MSIVDRPTATSSRRNARGWVPRQSTTWCFFMGVTESSGKWVLRTRGPTKKCAHEQSRQWCQLVFVRPACPRYNLQLTVIEVRVCIHQRWAKIYRGCLVSVESGRECVVSQVQARNSASLALSAMVPNAPRLREYSFSAFPRLRGITARGGMTSKIW